MAVRCEGEAVLVPVLNNDHGCAIREHSVRMGWSSCVRYGLGCDLVKQKHPAELNLPNSGQDVHEISTMDFKLELAHLL